MISFKHFIIEEKLDIDTKIKAQLVKKAEETLKKGDFWANKTPAEQEAALKEIRKKTEEDYNNLPEEEKQKKRDQYSKTKSTKEPKEKSAKEPKEKPTEEPKEKSTEEPKEPKKKSTEEPKEPKKKSEKNINTKNKTTSQFIKSYKEAKEQTWTKRDDGVIKALEEMTPQILGICAICCPVATLFISAAFGLGAIIAMTVRACKENKNEEAEKAVIEESEKVAKKIGDDDIIQEISAVKKSAISDDGEPVSAEEFTENLEKNNIPEAKDAIIKNEKVIKNISQEKLAEATNAVTSSTDINSTTEKLTDEDIEKMQNDIENLDPEKDKDKINEIVDKLKKAAKDNNKDENEYLLKTDKDENGNPRQRKTGPRGGKYYRVKGDDGWGPWNSAANESLSSFLQNGITENKLNILSEYLKKIIIK